MIDHHDPTVSHVDPGIQETSSSLALTIPELLEAQAERTPDAVAIVAPGRRPLTYGRLRVQVEETVYRLNAMGLGSGDRVAIVLPHGPEMAVAFLAVAAGATSAPLNPAYREREFGLYLSDLRAKALIIQPGIDSPAIKAAQACGIPTIELTPVSAAEAGIFTLKGSERSHAVSDGFGQPDDVALVLHTSGTTSRPKIVPLTQTNLCAAAQMIRVALELTEKDRCLNVMPLFHIHGLMVTLSSVLAGGSVCAPDLNALKFFEWMEEVRATWYTTGPPIHRAILAEANLNRRIISSCPLRFIRSSSAPLPPQLMAELETVFNAPVIEGYGMTESSLCVTNNPLPPRKRKRGSVGVAVVGLELGIIDEAGNLLPHGQTGEIVFRGANVTLGYENNPAANKSAFIDGWFRSGDQGYLDSEGYLYITGRLKEIINRGGEKISPREVDEVLLDHPAVAQAVTFSTPHPTLGEDIAVAIVMRENTLVSDQEIREFAAKRLAHFKVPRQVFVVKEIPKGPTGKLQRIGLAEKLGVTDHSQLVQRMIAGYPAPRTSVEKALASIWAHLFRLKRVGLDDNFFELGGDSLLAMRLFAQIEKFLGRRLQLGTLIEVPTVRQLAGILDKESWSCVVPVQPTGSKLPLFCVHEVLGGVFFYRDLARYLGPDQPFYALQPQAKNGKQILPTRIEDMAADYIKAIRTVQPNGPYFLGGFSFGGMVAFEMARQLRGQGQEVALVAFIDTRAPGYPKSLPRRISHPIQRIARHWSCLRLLRPKQKLTHVLQGAGRVRKRVKQRIKKRVWSMVYQFYSALNHPLPRALRNVGAANRRASAAYVPKVYPGGATLFRATEQPSGIYPDPTLGWGKFVSGGVEIHEVPGDHESIVGEPNIRVLAEELKACLDRAHKG